MTPQQLEERRVKGIFFNCDKKYNMRHKWGKIKIFYIEYDDEELKEHEPPQGDELEVITATISCHALARINTPQTLNIKGYIKNEKVTVEKNIVFNNLPNI